MPLGRQAHHALHDSQSRFVQIRVFNSHAASQTKATKATKATHTKGDQSLGYPANVAQLGPKRRTNIHRCWQSANKMGTCRGSLCRDLRPHCRRTCVSGGPSCSRLWIGGELQGEIRYDPNGSGTVLRERGDLEIKLKNLLAECRKYSDRRNEIAHGKCLIVADEDADGAPISRGYYHVPNFYNPKQFPLNSMPTYMYTSKTILSFAERFEIQRTKIFLFNVELAAMLQSSLGTPPLRPSHPETEPDQNDQQ
jgi:hypothetical protein